MELVGSCVRSDKCGAHNLLKLHFYSCSSEVKDTIDVRISIVELSLDCWLCPDPTRELSSKIDRKSVV